MEVTSSFQMPTMAYFNLDFNMMMMMMMMMIDSLCISSCGKNDED